MDRQVGERRRQHYYLSVEAEKASWSVPALLDIELAFDSEEFLDSQGEALRRPAMQGAARDGLARAAGLVSPGIVYDWFPVGTREDRKVEIGGIVFELGRHADLLHPAELAFIAVLTIGPRLEAESRALQAAGKALDAFMLDAAGVYGVGKAIELARSIVEGDAAGRGWRVGAELAPGQLSGWAIAEQKFIAQLLDLGSIGVHVTDSGMLVPQKSASILVGTGPQYDCAEVRSPCEYCDLSATCHYRH